MVRLVPMSDIEYQSYLALAVRDYADEKVAAGNWQPAEALERSAQEFQRLLPDGVATQDNYLFNIEDQALAAKVGMIWLARLMQGAHPIVFIYDFRIDEPYRRRGYGGQANGVQLIVFTGRPGSGKSSIAEAAARELGIPVFAKDWLETTLIRCELKPAENGPPLGSAGYQLLTTLAEHQLHLGQSVILDSVASTLSIRAEWRLSSRMARDRVYLFR